eukprot:4407789-Amphidinium_carterae.1
MSYCNTGNSMSETKSTPLDVSLVRLVLKTTTVTTQNAEVPILLLVTQVVHAGGTRIVCLWYVQHLVPVQSGAVPVG